MPTYYVYEDGAGWVSASSAGFTASPLTTKGDLYGYSTTNARVPVGTDGDVLTADSTQTLGVKWSATAASGVSSLDSITGAVTLVAGSNVTITDNSPSAGDITIAASGTGSGGMVSLFDSTLASAAATIDTGAGGIASGSSSIIILITARTAYANRDDVINLTFNADSGTNYIYERLTGVGGTVSGGSSGAGGLTAFQINTVGASGTAGYTSSTNIVVPNYDGTTFYKSCTWTNGRLDIAGSATSWFAELRGLMYTSTSAISRATIVANSGANFVAGTRMTILGTP